jgi:two-component system, NarL family, sensor histidine kinase BarA
MTMPTLRAGKILIVDDLPDNIEVLLAALDDSHDVRFATSGAEMFALLDKGYHPDVVLLDVMMPEMDGFEACQRLKADALTRDIPVLFVTARHDTESETRAFAAGAVDFIHKPIQREVVRARVGVQLELMRHRHHLQAVVDERTRDLAAALDRAEAAARAKDAFLRNMTHEVRTPMFQIKGLAGLLRGSVHDQRGMERLALLDTALNDLLRLSDSVIEYARLQAGGVQISHDPWSLEALVDRLDQRYGTIAEDLGLQLVFERSERVPDQFKGDRSRIERVLGVLLSNAIKFSERGRIVVGIQPQERTAAATTVRFSVQDEGVGIDPDVQSRLFQLFEPGDGSDVRRYSGVGLGLALAQRLVALMGGRVQLTSVPGRGSHFWFDLRLEVLPPERADTAQA